MKFLLHDPRNFVNAEGMKDTVFTESMLLDELGKSVAMSKPELISALRNSGIRIGNNPSNAKLIKVLSKNLPVNAGLQKAVASVIYNNNAKYMGAIGLTSDKPRDHKCHRTDSELFVYDGLTTPKPGFGTQSYVSPNQSQWGGGDALGISNFSKTSGVAPTITGTVKSRTTAGQVLENETFQQLAGGLLGSLFANVGKNKAARNAAAINASAAQYNSLLNSTPPKSNAGLYWGLGIGAVLIAGTIITILVLKNKKA